MEKDILSDFLNLEKLKVLKYKHFKNHTEIDVEVERTEQICPICSEVTNWIQSRRTQKIRDVNFGDKKTYLILHKKRYKCKHCGKTFMEENKVLNTYQRMTTRLVNEILLKLESERSFTSIAKDYNISVNTVIRLFDKIQYPEATLEDIEVLSIDEFKGNTGGEKYNCIITCPKTRQVLDILPTRKYNDLANYFKNKNREDIKYFVSDMWQPYKELGKVFFKDAILIVDKYHWIRLVIWAFENVRKEEQKKFYKKYRRYFKKSKRLLTKRYEFLNDEEKRQVDIMLYKSDNILLAHSLKEEFLELLDIENIAEAIKLMKKWILSAQESGLKAFEKCANTIIKWSKGILNSFEEPYTNGFTEGCNNKIKVLKRNAYGYRNFKRFRNRILHMFAYKTRLTNNN